MTVLNGTGVPGQAADVAGALGSIGFNVVDIASNPDHVERTTVRYGYYAGGLAKRVAAHITGGAALVQDDTLGFEEVVVVTGSDFTTIHDQPAPEGSPDDRRTTTTTTATSSTAPGETTTTTVPPTTTTTVIGYSTGEPPEASTAAELPTAMGVGRSLGQRPSQPGRSWPSIPAGGGLWARSPRMTSSTCSGSSTAAEVGPRCHPSAIGEHPPRRLEHPAR